MKNPVSTEDETIAVTPFDIFFIALCTKRKENPFSTCFFFKKYKIRIDPRDDSK